MQWDDWLKCVQEMENIDRERGQKNRIKGEVLVWEILNERCRPIHNGDSLKLEAVIRIAESPRMTRES